ncbi:HNH endonuclease, partial [Caldibacillus thermoamylovorans]|uniref:HNH endonuclease n=1 Tax=Caldibacillus thermoamylovorans TaxID=35841 RepID=UPI0020402149
DPKKFHQAFRSVYDQVVNAPIALTKAWFDTIKKEIGEIRLPQIAQEAYAGIGAAERTVKDAFSDAKDLIQRIKNTKLDELDVGEAGGATKGTGNALDGVRIINKKYAGKVYNLSGDLGKKYPEGIKFSKEGFPDFSPYSKAKLEIEGLIGDHYYDFKKANEVLGLKNTPAGYTWHHVEDGKTMMLVPSDIHGAVRHTGGASLINKGLRP